MIPVVVGLALALGAPTAENDGLDEIRSASRQAAAHPDLGEKRVVLRWRPREGLFEFNQDELDSTEVPRLAVWLASLAQNLLLGVLLVVALGGLGYLVVATVRERRKQAADRAATRAKRPDTLFGLDLRPEALPADITGAARRAWAGGRPELALSLLYRAALAFLIDQRDLVIPSSATEGECVELVARTSSQELSWAFKDLTDAWLLTAYGKRVPRPERFEALVSSWARVLGGGGVR